MVHDTSGAVVPDAVLTVTNTATKASRWVSTNSEGRYAVPGLAPGNYEIRAQATGMKAVSTTAIPLEAGQEQIVDFQLETGP